jgi:HlyD family secretion protein
MTANISCEVGRDENKLRVPNAALRFKPDSGETPQHNGGGNGGGGGGGGNGGGFGGGSHGGGDSSHSGKPKNIVWILDPTNQTPKAVTVRIGLNDGAFTEIREPSKLEEGADVIIGYESADNSDSATVNPFAPKFNGPRPR